MIEITPKLVALVVTTVVGLGTIIGWSDEIGGHMTVEPRVTILEDKMSCQSCIDMLMEQGAFDRQEAEDECRSYSLCPVVDK